MMQVIVMQWITNTIDSENDNDVPPRRSTRPTSRVDYSDGMNLKTRIRNLRGDSVNVGYTGLSGNQDPSD